MAGGGVSNRSVGKSQSRLKRVPEERQVCAQRAASALTRQLTALSRLFSPGCAAPRNGVAIPGFSRGRENATARQPRFRTKSTALRNRLHTQTALCNCRRVFRHSSIHSLLQWNCTITRFTREFLPSDALLPCRANFLNASGIRRTST